MSTDQAHIVKSLAMEVVRELVEDDQFIRTYVREHLRLLTLEDLQAVTGFGEKKISAPTLAEAKARYLTALRRDGRRASTIETADSRLSRFTRDVPETTRLLCCTKTLNDHEREHRRTEYQRRR